MDVISFFSQLSDNPKMLADYSLVFFRADVISALFFSRLLEFYKSKQITIVTIDLSQTAANELNLLLDTAFLGQRLVYCLRKIEELDSAAQKDLLAYLNKYQGPHTVNLFSSSIILLKERKDLLVVDLPAPVTPPVYKQLFAYFYPDHAYTPQFTQQLFKRREQISLDTACFLMRYHACAGQKCDLFFEQWFGKLVISDKSLFTLSQYLFAQQPREFFTYWSTYKFDYPDEFWIAYWLEQLWQASLFVHKAQTLGLQEAKKTAYRIPFSFINKDWRNYTYNYLAQAHHQLYLLDYNLKNGIGNYGLDLWYNKFFLK